MHAEGRRSHGDADTIREDVVDLLLRRSRLQPLIFGGAIARRWRIIMKFQPMRYALLVGIAGMSVTLGCSTSGSQQVTDTSSSSSAGGSGDGGADAGRICTWSGTGGGITIPDCTKSDTAIFRGMLDGKPY